MNKSRIKALVLSSAILSACVSADKTAPENFEPRLGLAAPINADTDHDQADAIGAAARDLDRNQPPASREVFRRTPQTDQTTPDAAEQADERRLSLNFANAPIEAVARAVISEALQLPVFIADGVTGTVSLESPEPVEAAIALSALERVLADSGVAMRRIEEGYLLLPLTAAEREGQTLGWNEPRAGYGVTILPVKHIGAGDLAQLIEPIKSSRVTVTADENRALLFLRGPRPDVEGAIAASKLFDVDWLSERHIGLFRLRHVNAEDLKAELERVLLRDGAAPRDLDLFEMPRLNAIFVASRTYATYAQARDWIERLDITSDDSQGSIHYYAVRNTPAADLATALSSVFITTGENEVGATIVPDELNNALIIRADAELYREIEDLLVKMDTVSPQVLIEAAIVEVRLTDDLRYGVQWSFDRDRISITFSGDEEGSVSAQFPGLSTTFVGADIRAALNLLASVSDIQVLSAPKIVVLNNQTATLQVGDEVPIVTQQAQSVLDPNAPLVSTVELRDTGVILEVTPRINSADNIVMEITQEVSSVARTTTSGIDSPTIQQRQFTSSVSAENGQTIALGGLIQETEEENHAGIPVLMDLPVVGALFRTNNFMTRRSELIVFLTPRIVGDAETAQAILEDLQNEMGTLREALDEY